MSICSEIVDGEQGLAGGERVQARLWLAARRANHAGRMDSDMGEIKHIWYWARESWIKIANLMQLFRKLAPPRRLGLVNDCSSTIPYTVLL
jgi:hypothetical protein